MGPRLLTVCLLLSGTIGRTQPVVTITAHPASPGITIPNDFIGLSFESGSLTTATGFPAENVVFQRMVSQLGPGLLRFGGNSVDKLTGWMRGQRVSSTSSSIMTSSDADRVLAFARAVGWKVLWSVGLGHGDPATDADQAAYVYQNGNDVVSGFEIGNEPDLFHSNGLRDTTYTVNDYIAEWKTYANTIQATTPKAVLTGSAAAGSITTWTTTFATQLGSRIALLTQHLYPLAPSSVNPTASNVASIAHILGTAAHNTEDTDGSQLLQIAAGQKIPWRMSETNSCYNGGELGVSNVFASALWGVDYMFTLAKRSSAGVNFHGGGTGNYTPIAVSGSSVTSRPLYYALLMFRAAARGRVVPLDVATNGVALTAYGMLDTDGTLRVVVVNQDQTQSAAVSLVPGTGYTSALAITLAAPSLTSTTGVTLGSASTAADGSWAPSQVSSIAGSSGTFQTTVASGSAVLVSFGNGSMQVENAASGAKSIAPNSLASAYGQALGVAEAPLTSTAPATSLGGVSGTITDSTGTTQPVTLSYTGPSQVNFLVPGGVASGTATVRFGDVSGTVTVGSVSPGLFALGATRTAAATAVRYPAGQSIGTAVPVFDCSSGTCQPVAMTLNTASTLYVSLYATGIRGASSVTCTIGGVSVPVTYAGTQGAFAGLDQINIQIPSSLALHGTLDVVVTAGGQQSNTVQLAFN